MVDSLGICPSFQPAERSFSTVFGSRSVGGVSNQPHILQQRLLGRRKARFVDLPFDDCFYTFIRCSLNPQEVSMAVQSIWTPVQIRDVAGDHLFLAARKMTFREMNRIS